MVQKSRGVTMYWFLPDSCPWVPGPKGSIFLIKSTLCSRTYNDSIDPSIHIQQAGLWIPSTLLPPMTYQPTFSPVTLTHNLVIHTCHHCTLYILYFTWKILVCGFWDWISHIPGWQLALIPLPLSPKYRDHIYLSPHSIWSVLGTESRDSCMLNKHPPPAPQKIFSFIPNTENIFSLTSMYIFIGNGREVAWARSHTL